MKSDKPYQLWAVWEDGKGLFISGHDTLAAANHAKNDAEEEDTGMFDRIDLFGFGEFKVKERVVL